MNSIALEAAGWIGSVLFAICGLPQAIACIRTGNAQGVDGLFLLAWLLGEIFTLIYVWPRSDWPLIFNYTMNLVFVLIIFKYKLRPRSEGN